MAAVLSEVRGVKIVTDIGGGPLLERFSARRSKELVVAFAGPIGCGAASVINMVDECLRGLGYTDVVRIKLSDFLEEATNTGRIASAAIDPTKSQKFNRYRRLQETGMALRSQTVNQAILAEYAIKTIRVDREGRTPTSAAANSQEPAVPHQVAYLIDQVKRPEEVVLLRALYRNLFHLVGVTKTYDERLQLLEDDGVRSDEAPQLVEIDRNENADAGQKLDKTLHLADYFVRNEAGRPKEKRDSIDRFIRLIHGDKSATPTHIEQGMYAAYAAGLRSGCLSRQVGAAIATPAGQIVATGCNDVPKAGGGLYSEGAGDDDQRCLHRPEMHCFNDFHKKQLQQRIGEELDRVLAEQLDEEVGLLLSPRRRKLLLDSIYKKTRLKDLIEYSRSVHAEMDAIVSMARLGGAGIQDAVLFTTTFPCHSCARHIVAAGIAKVYYVEPYEKSMAKDLHEDAISFEISSATATNKKVEFIHFEGISPRRFAQFFQAEGRKDEDGRLISMAITPVEKVLPEYLDNYQVFEEKAVEHFMSDLRKIPPAIQP